MIQRIMVAGGGTGGHLFPGLAVVDELRRRLPEIEVRFVGTARGIESRILPRRGESLELLDVTPLKGQGFGARFKSFARIPTAMRKASALMDDFEPDLVLGVGGYASGPVLLSASLSGRPTALLEQNAQVGMTNRILARFVDRAYISFEQTEDVFGQQKVPTHRQPGSARVRGARATRIGRSGRLRVTSADDFGARGLTRGEKAQRGGAARAR